MQAGLDRRQRQVEHFGRFLGGQSVHIAQLSTERSLADVARELKISATDLEARLPGIRTRLRDSRSKRPPPLRDEKVIVAWNGLAISAFARAAIVLGEKGYADAALRAARTLVAPLRAEHELPHQFVNGKPPGRGFSDDHVLLAAALLDVFEMDGNPRGLWMLFPSWRWSSSRSPIPRMAATI